jgi:hypothetical protein
VQGTKSKRPRLDIKVTPKKKKSRAVTVADSTTASGNAGPDAVRAYAPPPELDSKLMEFQRDGIKFALGQRGRCLIGDDMGE